MLPSGLYKQKALTYFKTLIPDYLFTINIYIYIYQNLTLNDP